jgi:hypothetical protein
MQCPPEMRGHSDEGAVNDQSHLKTQLRGIQDQSVSGQRLYETARRLAGRLQ